MQVHLRSVTDIPRQIPHRFPLFRLAIHCSSSLPNSGIWLNSSPFSSAGILLDDKCNRIRLTQRLGFLLYELHKCSCREILHYLAALARAYSPDTPVNDIIKDVSVFSSQLEPAGLECEDGKHLDRITLFLFESGKSRIWHATRSYIFPGSNPVI